MGVSKRFYSHLPESGPNYLAGRRKEAIADGLNDTRAHTRRKRPVPYFHNDLHDLESLWRIAVWVLFTHNISSRSVISSSIAKERQAQRKAAAAELFPENADMYIHRMFPVSKDEYFRRLTWLPDRLRSIKAVLTSSGES